MGYFLILFIFMIIAIARAGKGHPWIWFCIGALIYLISLSGLSSKPYLNTSSMWVIYLIILLVSGLIILSKSSKAKNEYISDEYVEQMYKQKYKHISQNMNNYRSVNTGEIWICSQCGNSNPEQHFICKCGQKKSENDKQVVGTKTNDSQLNCDFDKKNVNGQYEDLPVLLDKLNKEFNIGKSTCESVYQYIYIRKCIAKMDNNQIKESLINYNAYDQLHLSDDTCERIVDVVIDYIYEKQPNIKTDDDALEALNAFVELNARKNKEENVDNKFTENWGLVPDNPIFVKGFKGMHIYIEHLLSLKGEDVELIREGSISIDGINGPVDRYKVIGKGFQLAVFICNYGNDTPNKAPKGLSYRNDALLKDTRYYKKDTDWICTQCGNSNPEHYFICKCGRKKSENI